MSFSFTRHDFAIIKYMHKVSSEIDSLPKKAVNPKKFILFYINTNILI